MPKRRLVWICLTVILGLVVGFIAGSRRASEHHGTQVVRTYTVPPERADEIRNSLNRLFSQRDGDSLGGAQVFGGLLVVRAPESYQHGIARMVEELSQEKTPPRTTVRLDYWLVLGSEAKESNAEAFPLLTAALSSITKLDGHRQFRVLEHLCSNSLTDQETLTEGSVARTNASVSLNNGNIGLRLDFSSKLGKIKTDTQVRPGEFLVLGQNALNLAAYKSGDKLTDNPTANIYYIIRADLAK